MYSHSSWEEICCIFQHQNSLNIQSQTSSFLIPLCDHTSVLLGWDSRNEEETENCDTSGGSAERRDHRQRSSPCESTSRTSANREGEGIIESKSPYIYTFLQRMVSVSSQTALCSWSVLVVLLYFNKLFCNCTRFHYPLEVLVTQIFCVSDKFNLCL